MKNILTYLHHLGFSEIEATLYITLLKYGSLTVAELAKKTKINRTAAYTYIASLTKKGVLIEMRKASRRHFSAIEPEQLHYLLDNKHDELKILEKQFPNIVQMINATLPKNNTQEASDIKYVKGRIGIDNILSEALSTTELLVYANLADSHKFVHPKEFMIFQKGLMQNKKLLIFEIIGDTPESVKQYRIDTTAKTGRYFYKFMPENIGLASATLIYDNKVAILNIKQEISGVVMHNHDYFNNSKKLFDLLWRLLPEPK